MSLVNLTTDQEDLERDFTIAFVRDENAIDLLMKDKAPIR